MPLVGSKNCEGFPLMKMEMEEVVTNETEESGIVLCGNLGFSKDFVTESHDFISIKSQNFRKKRGWRPSGLGAFRGWKDFRAERISLSLIGLVSWDLASSVKPCPRTPEVSEIVVEGKDPISSQSIEGRCMKKFGVCIFLNITKDSRVLVASFFLELNNGFMKELFRNEAGKHQTVESVVSTPHRLKPKNFVLRMVSVVGDVDKHGRMVRFGPW
ncbi:hypothetical protein FXO38_07133 [Capsicum annuum]|nr:hypothetical protein FXO38_07133 [Capsicum annuum]